MTPVNKTLRTLLTYLPLAAYAAAVAWLAGHHEPWRDEIERLVLAQRSSSPLDVLVQSRHNSHPFVWHMVLYVGWNLFHHPMVLQGASLLVAVAAAWVWIRYAPFHWLIKCLFLAGYYPIYEYSVIAANYGVSMLFLFVFCAWYPSRFEKPLRLGALLALLANTNVHSLLITGGLGGMLAWEWLRHGGADRRRAYLTALGLAAAGAAFSLVSIIPPADAVYPKWRWAERVSRTNLFAQAVFVPGRFLATGLGRFGSETASCLLLWGCAAFFYWQRRLAGVVFWATATSIVVLFALVYPGAPRHQGFVPLLAVSFFWICGQPAFRRGRHLGVLFLAGLLALQVPEAVRAVGWEITRPYSNLSRLADFLRDDPRCRDAVLMGEPDYAVVFIGYYLDIPVYVHREGRFAKVVSLRTDNRGRTSLGKFLDDAERLRRETGKPVVMAFESAIDFRKRRSTMVFTHSYKKEFLFSPQEVERLLRIAPKVLELRGAITDENYDVYLLPAGA